MGKAVACRRDIDLSPLSELQYENDLYADSIYQRLMTGFETVNANMEIPPKKVDISTYQSLKGLAGGNQTGSAVTVFLSPQSLLSLNCIDKFH